MRFPTDLVFSFIMCYVWKTIDHIHKAEQKYLHTLSAMDSNCWQKNLNSITTLLLSSLFKYLIKLYEIFKFLRNILIGFETVSKCLMHNFGFLLILSKMIFFMYLNEWFWISNRRFYILRKKKLHMYLYENEHFRLLNWNALLLLRLHCMIFTYFTSEYANNKILL